MYLFLEEIFSPLKWVEDRTHNWIFQALGRCCGSPWVGRGSGEGPLARGQDWLRLHWESRGGGHVWGARYVTGRKIPYCYWEARKFPRDLFHAAGPDSSTFSCLFSPIHSGSRIGGSQAFCVQSALFLLLSLSFLTPPPLALRLPHPSPLTSHPSLTPLHWPHLTPDSF